MRPVLRWLVLAAVAALPPCAAAAQSAAPGGAPLPTVGVAPFEQSGVGGSGLPDVAAELAARLLESGSLTTVSPASLAGPAEAEPSAERVRALAAQHGLRALVVGRVTRLGDRASVDVRLRDGGNGGVLGTYVAELPLEDPTLAALDRLATRIARRAQELPAVASAPPEAAPSQEDAAKPRPQRRPRSRDTARLALDDSGDRSFSIRSDELEVSEGESARKLVFRGNVEARRGDLLLRAGLLDAVYPAGEKEPASLRARGSVRVRQGDREARCDRGDYRRSEERIHCTGNAVLRDGGDELRGESIVFDLARRSVSVDGQSELALEPRADRRGRAREGGGSVLGELSGEGAVRIRADGLEAFEEPDGGRRIVFGGNVVVTQEELVLRAREIEAHYPPEAREPERLEARGEVHVTQEGREARCDQAVYRRAEQRVDCTGNASLQEGPDRVTGNAIAFDLEREKLVVTGDTRLVLAPRPRKETATP